MISNSSLRVLGLMSGTSLDGVDLAACQFSLKENQWQLEVIDCETIEYSDEQISYLKSLEKLTGSELWQEHINFGKYLGTIAKQFIAERNLKIDRIASHGHTLFHRPDLGYTFQAGHGQSIAITSGVPTVADFRQKDISLGGQGAPLVPIGDLLLYPDFEACLNLGGFANISIKSNPIIAYDICPVNYLFNPLAQKLGKPYDESGQLARSGELNQDLLKQLNRLDYYQQQAPKSLGREWVESQVLPLLKQSKESELNLLRTLNEHCAEQIAKQLENSKNCLLTGGGAYNEFLVEQIRARTSCEIHIPGKQTIDFKEAILFAFLGTLHAYKKVNCLAAVTGATRDSTGGVYYTP